jgi:hypothetical protein
MAFLGCRGCVSRPQAIATRGCVATPLAVPDHAPMPLLAGLGTGKATFLLHRAIVAATPTADTAACKAVAAHSVLPPMRQMPGDEGIVVALGVGGIKPVDAGGLPLTERFAGIETMARAH